MELPLISFERCRVANNLKDTDINEHLGLRGILFQCIETAPGMELLITVKNLHVH